MHRDNYSVKIGNQLQINSHIALAFQYLHYLHEFLHNIQLIVTTPSLDECCHSSRHLHWMNVVDFRVLSSLSVYDPHTDKRVLTSLNDWFQLAMQLARHKT